MAYSITAGNGAITVAAALDYETTSSYTLTVQADGGNGGTASTTVNITVTDVDETAEAGASSWETTMTVGEYGDWHGYTDPSVAKGNPAGSFGSASFDWDGTTYHVRRLLDSGYGDLDLPFDEAPIRTDAFIQWTLDNTWTIGSVLKVELLRP